MPEPNEGQYRSPSELKAELEAERAGDPFLVLTDADSKESIVALSSSLSRLGIGRSNEADLDLAFDDEVSRIHAELVRVGKAWTLSDDGLSKNGTFVNERQIGGRQRLFDGDVIRVGTTPIRFRDPNSPKAAPETVPARGEHVTVSDAQHRVLVALCRPLAEGDDYRAPAANEEIAAELVISVDAVKSQLRQLFKVFSLDHLPRYRKRLALAETAVRRGVVSPRDLRD